MDKSNDQPSLLANGFDESGRYIPFAERVDTSKLAKIPRKPDLSKRMKSGYFYNEVKKSEEYLRGTKNTEIGTKNYVLIDGFKVPVFKCTGCGSFFVEQDIVFDAWLLLPVYQAWCKYFCKDLVDDAQKLAKKENISVSEAAMKLL